MSAHILLNTSSKPCAGRKPQLVRAHAVPHARRHRYHRPLCGPSLMALNPFDSLFDLSPSHLLETEEFMGLERARAMAVDFVEDRNGFQIKADIPGVDKKDIHLHVDNYVVTISAKRSSETTTKPQTIHAEGATDPEAVNGEETVHHEATRKIQQPDTNVLRYERFDSFQSRSFRVPRTADLKKISAKYENGVLTVDISKQQDVLEQSRTVDIS